MIEGVVERRLLVNYRVDPEVVRALLPPPLRPQLVEGWAVAGVCLIRLGHTRPQGWPVTVGLRSENAAHRIAVEWDDATSGVYIPRRDTGSLPNALIGGRLFPGEHHRAKFTVDEGPEALRVGFESRDGRMSVDVRAEVADDLRGSRLFPDVAAASAFFEQASVGYSETRDSGRLDGVELRTDAWRVTPVRLVSVRSSFVDQLPAGSATLDCGLLMRDVPVTWHACQSLRVPAWR